MTGVSKLFEGCGFKFLAKSDTGEETGNICGILIPQMLRVFFPILPAPRTADEIVYRNIRAKVLASEGAEVVDTVYRAQTRTGKRSPETRITGNLKALRGPAKRDDILIIRSIQDGSVDLELRILQQGTRDYDAVSELAGKRRWGVIPRLPPVPVYTRADLKAERRLVARIERVEAVTGSKFISVEFDGIDADLTMDEVGRALENPNITAPFALARIVSTRSKLKDIFGPAMAEGAWAELLVQPRAMGSGPLAFLAQLEGAGYTTRLSGRLGSGRILLGNDEEPRDFPEAGASVSAAAATARRIAQKCHLPGPRLNGAAIVGLLSPVLAHPATLLVRDVGQASFVTILANDGSQLAHFDAGWPISFNDRTVPSALPLADPVPVILSHWDWDHLHGFHTVGNVASSVWIVPDQTVGPGAMKVANTLHAARRLKIWSGGNPLVVGPVTLYACVGGPNVNNSGIALTIELTTGKRALLVGDACYANVGLPPHTTFDLLVATHHGAGFEGNPPIAARRKSPCVVSVGPNNVYRHPCSAALAKHERADWAIYRTSGVGKRKRGDQPLA